MGRFDREAATYDARTGIPVEQRPAIVRALARMTGVAAGDVFLELGAGTGQLGACFPALGLRYVGLDASAPMLEVFARRLSAEDPRIQLIHADADGDWPVQSASVRAVFSSRAVHLFDLDHVVAETLRVALGPGATFTLGRVQRDERSVRSVLRREMRTMLAARGFVPRDGERGQRRVLDAFRARGAVPLDPVAAASWPDRRSAMNVLDAWRQKPGLGGCDPPDEAKAAVLADVQRWAAARFGSLHAPGTAEESYILEGVTLPAG
ncbi:MAG TPA: class I SAM-dependent methyltransferase [Candidatus Elarobacter sp.]